MGENLLIKNGLILDIGSGFQYDKRDILIENGIITMISKNIKKDDFKTFDASGLILSPGFIDVHVHCYYGSTAIGISPSDIGAQTGVTTLIDAGTSGANNIDDFYKRIIRNSATRVFVLLNTASDGLVTLSELSEDGAISADMIKNKIAEYSKIIIGLKARASSSVLKEKGITPIKASKKIAEELNLPLVVHIGNAPPRVEEVLEIVTKGDVITHCYHNKPNGLFKKDGAPKPEVLRAKERGVLFDVGHGSSSFSFDIAVKAIENGFEPDFIGSDIYDKNKYTVVKSLENTMNKIIASGLEVEDVIKKVTNDPAGHYKLEGLGFLRQGFKGDITAYKINDSITTLRDSLGIEMKSRKWIESKYTVVDGTLYKVNDGGK
ncbi:amidohydrolase/deacetylase family metallohydrolase [Wukongibacter sp. M2B1]|uniref:amidohydrolase/deacetylase family metallohydrolase n=1 Tax=Wukongibacter sp. M2B1 TaxID=3088895 RepID=UPI003D7BEB29